MGLSWDLLLLLLQDFLGKVVGIVGQDRQNVQNLPRMSIQQGISAICR